MLCKSWWYNRFLRKALRYVRRELLKSYLYSGVFFVVGFFCFLFFCFLFCYGRMYRLKLQSDLWNSRPVCCSLVVNFFKWSHLPALNAVPNDKCIRICYIEFYGRCQFRLDWYFVTHMNIRVSFLKEKYSSKNLSFFSIFYSFIKTDCTTTINIMKMVSYIETSKFEISVSNGSIWNYTD